MGTGDAPAHIDASVSVRGRHSRALATHQVPCLSGQQGRSSMHKRTNAKKSSLGRALNNRYNAARPEGAAKGSFRHTTLLDVRDLVRPVPVSLAHSLPSWPNLSVGWRRAHMGLLWLQDGARPNLQSVLEANDLDELMQMADLEGREFEGERTNVVVVSQGGQVVANASRFTAEDIRKEEERTAHLLSIPRRPPWNTTMSKEVVDHNERTIFLDWRRSLAELENNEMLTLTPFEKNLEVWRQLWRVLERSHVVCQVIDGRHPSLYRCADLERYIGEVDEGRKKSVLLLNKADLIPEHLRQEWADYFNEQGVLFAYWSAKTAADNEEDDNSEQRAQCPTELCTANILNKDQILELLAEIARMVVMDKGGDAEEERLMIGLVGFPNVGKSSTINALVGSKKTGVGATPGKTKHFQTLNIDSQVTLCDCPGLVFPNFAKSRPEMTAYGILPIDRLNSVQEPVGEVVSLVSKEVLEATYKIVLPESYVGQPTAVKAMELMQSYAAARGYSGHKGLPDFTRAGRYILKDFASGRLLHAYAPEGSQSGSYCAGFSTKGELIDKYTIVGGVGGMDASVDQYVSMEQEHRALAASQEAAQVISLDDDDDIPVASSSSSERKGNQNRRPEYKFHNKVCAPMDAQ
eukprot:scaffold2298_cov388-Prasinococcus_capsulatus_cf.AAC.2